MNRINYRDDADIVRQIDELSKRTGMSRSIIIRQAIRFFLEAKAKTDSAVMLSVSVPLPPSSTSPIVGQGEER